MKKLILLLFTIMSMGLSANAQMCQTTGNVEPSITSTSAGSQISVSLQNYNNYMVTVDVTITVVSTEGSEKQYTRTVVLKGGETKDLGNFSPESGDVSVTSSSVSLQVMRCD